MHAPETHMARLVHELGILDRPRLIEHFQNLEAADRRLRFGLAVSDEFIADYVNAIDFTRDHLFGIFGPSFELIAVAHMGRAGEDAELGLSVLKAHRRGALARRLVSRATRRAIALGRQRLWIHFVSDNHAMARFTRDLGMEVRYSQGEADGWLTLPAASALQVGIDLYYCQIDGLLGAWRGFLNPLESKAA
jgi:GNAT superfamily N-acetyltransferase